MTPSLFRLSLAALALALNISVHPSAAADDALNPTIATIDMKQIFATHPKTKEAEWQINAERNTTKRALDDAEAKLSQLKTGIKDLDTDLATGKLGDTAREQTTTLRKEKGAQFQLLDAQMRALRDESMKELQRASLRMRDAILDAIHADLSKTPELATTALVFDKSGPSMNAVPFVLYSNPSLDLSAAVQKKIGIDSAGTAKDDATASASLTMAIVDMKRVFDGYTKTKEAGERISEARTAVARELEERLAAQRTLTETIRKLDEQISDPALRETDRKARTQERSAKAIEAQTIDGEIAEFRLTRENQLQDQYVRLRDIIAGDIHRAITDGVKAETRVDLVLDSSATSLTGTPVLLRHQGIADWTEPLLAKLNSNGKSGTNRIPVKWEGGTTSTAKLRFAVLDLDRVLDSLPATKAANESIEQARAAAKADIDNGADPKAKQAALEEFESTKRAEIVESVKKQAQVTAVKSGCHLIFDSGGSSLNGVPFVKPLKALPDLSDEIIAALTTAPQ